MEEKEKKIESAGKKGSSHRLIQILGVLFALLFFTFCYSTYHLAKDLVSNQKDKKGFEELSAIVAQSSSSAQTAAPAVSGQQQEEQSKQTVEVPKTNEYGQLIKYVQLSEMNPEFFGWISIEGLGIDYPVMYSPTREEYYLNRDFYGDYSDSGIPFIDERCPADGNYYLIYGHLMQNKTVFGRLPQYESESCWRENPIIRFDTLTEEREYAVMACFYSRIYADNENGFRYYAIFDLTNEADFNYYVTQAKVNAIYETGITAEYGDELIVLSTCSHHVTDGRFAVVAKRIK
ncbi:MAG: sortase [Oscillospiraceae bacterium]|nr:sortase [Oscillospiraceae bacterium]